MNKYMFKSLYWQIFGVGLVIIANFDSDTWIWIMNGVFGFGCLIYAAINYKRATDD